MSRIQNLYKRLDDLERQLEVGVLAELDHVDRGERSRYLDRLRSPYLEGRVYRTAEVAVLEHLANEVITLKEKLGEPISSGVTSIVLYYENIRNLPRDQQPSKQEQINLARRKAHELRSEINQRSS